MGIYDNSVRIRNLVNKGVGITTTGREEQMKRQILSCLLALLSLVGVAKFSFAQSDTGRITGTVTDVSGAVVSGATVTVTNLGTSRAVAVTTGGAGDYSVPALPPGGYQVEVKATNFKTVSQEVTLQISQVLTLPFSLTAGAVTENVQVTSAAPLVSLDTSDLGNVISGPQVVDLPLNGRNFLTLATLVPGVTTGANINGNTNGTNGNAETYRYNTSGGTDITVNGLRAQANNYLLDGFDNNESLVNTIIFFTQPDAMREFRVETNIAPAEFGRAGGGIINADIKSGTNAIHGSVFEFLRNSALDATPWTPQQNAKKFPFKQNQFGGTIGAPIIRNKLFVFGDYQGLRSSQPASTDYVTVPTELMRSSGFTNFSELLPSIQIKNPLTGMPFPGNVINIPLNAAAVNYLNAFPAPNCNSSINSNCNFLTNNYTTTRVRTQTINDFDIKLDWNITDKDSAFGRYSYGNDNLVTTSTFANLPAGFGSGSNPTKPWAAVMEETHLFTPNLINEFRFGFIRTSYGYNQPFASTALSQSLGIVNANTNAVGQLDLPALGGGALIGGFNTQLDYTGDYGQYVVPQNSWQTADNLSWVKGAHTMKFGANIIRRQVNFFRPITGKGYFNLCGNGTNPATITGYEVTDLLVGFSCSYDVGPVLGNSQTRNWENGFFGQDSWRVSRRLTLNLGLRWDLLTWPVEKNNQQSNFNIFTGQIELAGQNGNSRSFIPVAYNNWAPRIGFAFDPFGDGTSKFSGGYGIFYFVDRGGISNQLAQNPPFSGETTFNYLNGYRITFTGQAPLGTETSGECLTSCDASVATAPLPSKGPIQVNLNNPQNVSISVATLPSNKTPGVQEWNFGYERQLGSTMTFSMTYVGTKGTHLVTYYNYNRQEYNTFPCSLTAPSGCNFPALGAINTQATIGNSSYNGLQTSLNRSFTNGLQFTAAYTWSHTIDNSPDAFDSYSGSVVNYRDLAAERASSNLDVRNRLVLNGMYALPFGRGQRWGDHWNGVLNAVAGGWQTNLIFLAQSGTPFDVICNSDNPEVRCNLVGLPSAGLTKPYQYFNPAAFAPVPTNSSGVAVGPGNLSRNFLTGPHTMNIDFSTFKNFKMGERVTTQFRAEFFNLTNTPQFVNPDATQTDATFGQLTSTRFSSERQIQFALKVMF